MKCAIPICPRKMPSRRIMREKNIIFVRMSAGRSFWNKKSPINLYVAPLSFFLRYSFPMNLEDRSNHHKVSGARIQALKIMDESEIFLFTRGQRELY
jgi:hypothetical protein